MSPLLRLILTLLSVFGSVFLIVKFGSGLTFQDVEAWLIDAQSSSSVYIAFLVITLLLADLVVSVPTLTITVLAGFLLGQSLGAGVALAGLYGSGIIGYWISRRHGRRLLEFVIRDENKRTEAIRAFEYHGFVMIALARAVPMLPEITACLAGATGMPFRRFLLAWSVNSIPYVAVASYAGSVSSLTQPGPGIYGAVGISATLWLGWFLFHRKVRRPSALT